MCYRMEMLLSRKKKAKDIQRTEEKLQKTVKQKAVVQENVLPEIRNIKEKVTAQESATQETEIASATFTSFSFGNCSGKTEFNSRTNRIHTPSLKCEECVASAAENRKITHNIVITSTADKMYATLCLVSALAKASLFT